MRVVDARETTGIAPWMVMRLREPPIEPILTPSQSRKTMLHGERALTASANEEASSHSMMDVVSSTGVDEEPKDAIAALGCRNRGCYIICHCMESHTLNEQVMMWRVSIKACEPIQRTSAKP